VALGEKCIEVGKLSRQEIAKAGQDWFAASHTDITSFEEEVPGVELERF
jgi:hypothetical protein